MLGRKEFTPKRFYEFSLEARVPERPLAALHRATLDLSFVRLTARFYSHTGRPGVDPVVLFKLMLLGYLYGITSERLAEEARLHLAFRWFLGYDLDETPPDLDAVQGAGALRPARVPGAFTEVVRQCERAGLVRGDVLYVDSTLVKANASLGSAGARALLTQLPSAGRVRRDGVAEIPSPIPRRQAALPARSSRRRTRPVASRRARRGARVAARGRSGGRAQQGPGAGERLGDQSHRSRRGAGQAQGSPTPSITRRTSAWTAGGRVSSPRWT